MGYKADIPSQVRCCGPFRLVDRLSFAAVLAVLGCALLVVACSAAPEGSSERESAGPSRFGGENALSVELDEVAGRLVMPIDVYRHTELERDKIRLASSASLAVCAQAQGVRFQTAPSAYDPIYESELFFGPWTLAQAEKFAFVMPQKDADLRANGLIEGSAADSDEAKLPPGAYLTDEDWEVMESCGDFEDHVRFTEDHYAPIGPWQQQIEELETEFSSYPEVEAIRLELVDCYRERGLEPDAESGWAPAGAKFEELSEEQITLAISMVECKNEIDATRRLAELMAAAQTPIVEEYADELAAQRRSIEETVAAADEYVAAHPEAFFEW